MDSKTIKVPVTTHKLLKDLCMLANLPQQEVIYLSLSNYKKKLFWEQCNSAYSKLNDNNDIVDSSLYENTILDGIEVGY